MGGKQKKGQAQRVKGNVRGSSSARAAELLSASGGASAGLLGFGGQSDDLGFVPLQGNDDVDASVDADFRMTLRKLSKRDPTTRLKALQELTTLCKEKDPELVKTMLPFWPRLYNKLSTDNDRRIREATQQCFEQLVLKVRHSLAPHLKGVMGCWLVAQCDAYAPAASAAKLAFQAAFPPTKQAEALRFCMDEIMNHLQSNLFTTVTIDPKASDFEEQESRHHKLLAASLSALRLFMTAVLSEHQTRLKPGVQTFLEEPKFWKLSKHKSNMIKAAHYSVLAIICEVQPELANEFADKLCPLVLHNLDESDPIICRALWEAVLHTLATVENCWQKVNPRKGVFPKLWTLLKTGGSGNAAVVFPNLLPLLSQIPEDLIGEGLAFYQEFFGNMKLGLAEKSVTQSVAEQSAVVRAMLECLRFVIFKNLDDQPGDHSDGQKDAQSVADFLVQDYLLPLLEISFMDKPSTLSSSPLYQLTCDLLISLHTISNSAEDSRQPGADKLAKTIWNDLGSMTRSYIDLTDNSSPYILARLATFLESFKVPATSVKIKTKEVRFAEESVLDVDSKPDRELPKEDKADRSIILASGGPVMSAVGDASARSYQKTTSLESLTHLAFLARMCKMYMCGTFAGKILDTVESDNGSDLLDVCEAFVQSILQPWFKAYCDTTGRDTKKELAEQLCEITHSVYSSDINKDQSGFLSQLTEISSASLLHLLVQKAISAPQDPAMTHWLKGAEFGQKMVAVSKSLCQRSLATETSDDVEGLDLETEACWGLLTVALSSDSNLEPILGHQHIESIVAEIKSALPSPSQLTSGHDARVQRCVVFVCDVAQQFFSNLQGCLLLASSEELLLALFQLESDSAVGLPESVLSRVHKAWQQGVKALLHQRGGLVTQQGFFGKVITRLTQQVLEETKTVESLTRLSSMVVKLCDCISENLPSVDEAQKDSDSVQNIYDLLVDPLAAAATALPVPQWHTSTLVSSELPFASCPAKATPVDVTVIPNCVIPIAFASQLLANRISGRTVAKNTAVETPQESGEKHEGEVSMADINRVHSVARAVALCTALLGRRSKSQQATELGKVTKLLQQNFVALLDIMEKDAVDAIVKLAIEKATSEGDLEAVTLKLLLKEINNMRLGLKVPSFENLDQAPSEASLQTLQVLLPYLPRDELLQSVEIRAAQLLSCPVETIQDLTGGQGFLAIISGILDLADIPLIDDSNTDAVIGVMAELEKWRSDHDDFFAFNSVVSSLDWRAVSFNIQVVRFLRILVVKMPSKLTSDHWDLILCSLAAWVQSCQESRADLMQDVPTQCFTVQVCDLLYAVSQCIQNIAPEQKDAFPPNIQTEWGEFFSEGIYSLLLPLFVALAEDKTLGQSSGSDALLSSLGRAVSACPVTHIKNHQLPSKLRAEDDERLEDSLQTLLNHLCPLLLHQNRAIQLTAYKLLKVLMPELSVVKKEGTEEEAAAAASTAATSAAAAKTDDKEETSRTPPLSLLSVLETSDQALEVILQDLRVDETMVIEPYIEEHTLAVAFLLCWKLILTLFKGAPSEMRAQYASYLDQTNRVNVLLLHLFRLMPESPTIQLTDSLTSQSPLQRLTSSKNLFAQEPLLDITEESSADELQHLACSVYVQALQDLPAIIRAWWTSQAKKTAGTVEKFTAQYVSPVLCTQELTAIHNKDTVLENMVIKARHTTREVVAIYNIDEVSMELVVTLPANYPLGNITVESGKRIGVTNAQWRNWMLQMITFLSHQNGSILDGLSLWKRNIDKRFSGVEDCMICFSVIHGSTYQLPKLQCHTCKKKYHSACLYKWFNTSNKSTCPLCRNLF